MKALLWKKINEFKNQKVRFMAALLIPIVFIIYFYLFPISAKNIAINLPLLNLILYWFLLFNIEDFVYAEVVFGTGINIFHMWLMNILLIATTSIFYSIVQFVIINLKVGSNITPQIIMQFISAYIMGVGLLCVSTFYISNYSKLRNLISSVGGIVNFMILIYIISTKGHISLISSNMYVFCGVSILLGVLSYFIVYKYSNVEVFIVNISKLSDAYEKNFIDE